MIAPSCPSRLTSTKSREAHDSKSSAALTAHAEHNTQNIARIANNLFFNSILSPLIIFSLKN